MTGYEALRRGAAWLDLTGRAHLRVTGEDRVRWLHAMVSNHVEQLRPGEGCYAFLLNAQGRILADAYVLSLPDCLFMDLEPEVRAAVLAHLDKHIIADDVTLEDLTGQTAVLGLEGPEAGRVLASLGAPQPEKPAAHAAWNQCRVARLSATGAPGFRLFAPREQRDHLVRRLEQAGAVAAAAEEARLARLENGRPRYGEDITDKHLPQETQLLEALHFAKGCYLGQEIVERIRARGMVHRFLVPLRIRAAAPPPPGSRILAGERDAGEITSAVFSPALGEVAALGYVRLPDLGGRQELEVCGRPAVIAARRPHGPA